jgi:HlyD family secretion protein
MRKKQSMLSLIMTLLLAGCGVVRAPEPEPAAITPTPSRYTADIVIAEAVIEPARWSNLRFQIGGTVTEILVEAGDIVEAGDTLARLDETSAKLAVQEAEAALDSARANLALLEAGPRAEEIAASEAELEDAKAALARAVAQQDQVTGEATEADIAAAKAEVAEAEVNWVDAQEQHREIYERSDDGKERENADYQYLAAKEALAAAQAQLEAQQNTVDDQLRESRSGVWLASAQKDVAQAKLELLKAGHASWDIAAAEAQVQQAQVALSAAEAKLARTVVKAPFDGTVTRVDVEVGNPVTAGQAMATLAALDHLQARTIDLTELDVARVMMGQSVKVTVDARPDQAFAGEVREIARQAGDYRGDVVYAVKIDLTDTRNVPLRWGMTAVVEIKAK